MPVLDREQPARRPRRAARDRGVTSRTVPGNAASAASSASRLSRSRWLVGSSRTSRFAPLATTSASASRRRSPPESARDRLLVLLPAREEEPSEELLRLGAAQAGRADGRVEHRAALVELGLVLGEVRGLDAVAELDAPGRRARAGRGSSRAESSCPSRSARSATTCSPRSSANDASSQQLLLAGAERRAPRPRRRRGRSAQASGTRTRACGAARARPRASRP